MKNFHSITYRITGLTFLIVALTVWVLIYLANWQMTELFQEYVTVQHMQMMQEQTAMTAAQHPILPSLFGPSEITFLTSVHQSLIWVGFGILLIGLLVSYALARSITVPIQKLCRAAEQIEQGNLGETVAIETKDEVGQLAAVFNRMSETLATNTKLRRQLLANIAHELRTPLAVIQGNLEGMVDGVIEPTNEQLRSLYEEAVRLNRLIKDLRDLSLAEVRQLALEKVPTDINQLLSRTVMMLTPLAEDKNIKIQCQLATELPDLIVDGDRINQVFYNILGNSIRYSPLNGRIQLITVLEKQPEQSWVKISIADNGPGISPEDLPYVFDHFYRGEKSRDRKSGGSGIGLAIVKQLVENHGGQVAVESLEGKGTVFHVFLPIAEAKE